MDIFIDSADPQTRGVNEEPIRNQIRSAVNRFEDRITRVEVHLKDANGPKSGNDKQCTIEARVAGMDPIAVTADADDLWAAVQGATGKLQRKLQSDVDRRRTH